MLAMLSFPPPVVTVVMTLLSRSSAWLLWTKGWAVPSGLRASHLPVPLLLMRKRRPEVSSPPQAGGQADSLP